MFDTKLVDLTVGNFVTLYCAYVLLMGSLTALIRYYSTRNE